MTGLENAPDDYAVPDEPEARERFRILNDRMLLWAVRKLRDVRKRRLERSDIATAEMDRIRRWLRDADAADARDADYFVAIITEYALSERAKGRKSLTTPWGEVRTRQTSAPWDIDTDAFLAWAKEHRPELVKTTETIRIAETRKTLAVTDGGVVDPDTGEVLPWVKVGEPGVSVSVDVDLGLHAEDEEEPHA